MLRSFFDWQIGSFTLTSLLWRILLLVVDVALTWEIVLALSMFFDRISDIFFSAASIFAILEDRIVMRDLSNWIQNTAKSFGSYRLSSSSLDRRPTSCQVAILLQGVYDVVENLVILLCIRQMHGIHQGSSVGRIFLLKVFKRETLMDESWHSGLKLNFAW